MLRLSYATAAAGGVLSAALAMSVLGVTGNAFAEGHTSPPYQVGAVKDWLQRMGAATGPLFRGLTRWGVITPNRLSDRAVARVIQQAAAAAGLNPTRFAGHSLRAGLASSAAAAGVSEAAIARTTGHRSMSVLRRYVRHGELFRDSPTAGIGL